jgi:hypothetical protein
MKSIYYSIFFLHYKFILLGRAGKLWSACSSSIVMAFTITLCFHFIIGAIIGKQLMILYESTLFGTIFLFLLITFNLVLFVKCNNYIEIEKNFENNRLKFKKAIVATIIYFSLVIFAFAFL